jgi:general secretion pathway protein C
LFIEVERDGRAVVVRVALDGDLGAAVAKRSPPPAADPDPPTFAGVTRIDDTHSEIERAVIDRILADPMSHTRGARVLPSVRNGLVDGIKLYAISPHSIYAAVGFSNGDTVQRINGMALESMDRALEIYTQLRDATRLELDVMRRGKPVTMVITIR